MSILKNMTVFLLFFGLSNILIGQNSICGTKITKAHKKYLENNTALKTAATERLNRTISITAHFALDGTGVTPYSEEALDSAIVELNELFEPIELSFKVCKVNYMENDNFFDFVKEDFEEEMFTMNYQPNTINLYLTNTIEISPNSFVGGYTYLPTETEFNKDVIVSAGFSAIPHEMGHYFGLYHTHETDFGIELVNGSNCEEAGDLICDTDADPYYEGIPMDSVDMCNIQENLLDPNNEFYVPPSNNIMSYYPGDCTCIFTNEQYNKMAATYLALREYLW